MADHKEAGDSRPHIFLEKPEAERIRIDSFKSMRKAAFPFMERYRCVYAIETYFEWWKSGNSLDRQFILGINCKNLGEKWIFQDVT
jgi:hypothetical protein